MKPRRLHIVLATALLVGAATVRASSLPVIQGGVSGVELCAQSMCGSAIFVALFNGQIGGNPNALGLISVSIKHEDLPPAGVSSKINSGVWQLQSLGRPIAGIVTGGTILNTNGDGTFQILVHMQITSPGASGLLSFVGELSHNVFPPSIKGHIIQQP